MNELMTYDLKNNINKKEEQKQKDAFAMKRVQVQAIDMDWLFQHDNAKTFISILSNCQSQDALTKQPIKMFITMMWKRFNPRIITWVFVPYICYLGLMCGLSGVVINKFLTTKEKLMFIKNYAQSFNNDSLKTDLMLVNEYEEYDILKQSHLAY